MNTEQLAAGHRRLLHPRRAESRHSLNDGKAITPARRVRLSAQLVSRALDLVVASSLLVVLAVPIIVICALIKLTSRGPALFAQKRVGVDGKSFIMLKFRTMWLDAEANSGPVWATANDPRCTRVGAFLRRMSLDELPQLINVLFGEMSLVGPRPERPHFVRIFSQSIPAYNERHQVLPGITGWAQVNGWRGDTSIEKRLEHDLHYVRHWSVLLNFRIMLLTPFRMFGEQHPR